MLFFNGNVALAGTKFIACRREFSVEILRYYCSWRLLDLAVPI